MLVVFVNFVENEVVGKRVVFLVVKIFVVLWKVVFLVWDGRIVGNFVVFISVVVLRVVGVVFGVVLVVFCVLGIFCVVVGSSISVFFILF